MVGRGRAQHHSCQQLAHQAVRDAAELDLRVAPEDVGQQGQCERMPVSQFHDGRLPHLGHPAVPQVREGVRRRQVAQRDMAQPARPSRVGSALGGERVSAGQHEQGRVRQPGQERLPEPSVERFQMLVAVDQQHRSGGHREARRVDRPQHIPRRGRHAPAVDTYEVRTSGKRLVGVQLQQGRLANAPGPAT